MVRRVAVSLRGVRQTTIGTHPARCSVPVHRPDHGVTAHTVHPYCQCGPSRLRPVTRRGAPRARVGRAKASAASSADGMAARLCRRQRRRQPDGGPATVHGGNGGGGDGGGGDGDGGDGGDAAGSDGDGDGGCDRNGGDGGRVVAMGAVWRERRRWHERRTKAVAG